MKTRPKYEIPTTPEERKAFRDRVTKDLKNEFFSKENRLLEPQAVSGMVKALADAPEAPFTEEDRKALRRLAEMETRDLRMTLPKVAWVILDEIIGDTAHSLAESAVMSAIAPGGTSFAVMIPLALARFKNKVRKGGHNESH